MLLLCCRLLFSFYAFFHNSEEKALRKNLKFHNRNIVGGRKSENMFTTYELYSLLIKIFRKFFDKQSRFSPEFYETRRQFSLLFPSVACTFRFMEMYFVALWILCICHQSRDHHYVCSQKFARSFFFISATGGGTCEGVSSFKIHATKGRFSS